MKTSIVLEGGGMRGAYTAGCMAWLIDHDIKFSSAYGISTGAVHLISYLLENKDFLYDLSTNHIADKKLIGIRPIVREGHYVGYDYLFDHILPVVKKYDITKAQQVKTQAKIGVYDLDKGHTYYLNIKDIDSKMDLLKAACTLPIIGRAVRFNGRKLLDGGITKMIPIEESIKDGNDYHLVITTKPRDYVRKPAPGIIKLLMKLVYPKHPTIQKDYACRHLNYNQQIEIIKELEDKNKAIYLYPSKTISVKRTSGDKASLRELYQLGYQDMEARKEEILKVFKHA